MPKPGGRLAESASAYGSSITRPGGGPPPREDRGRPDLADACDRRGIELTDEERAYLSSDFWSPEAARALLDIVEACERAGVPFTVSFDHQDGQPIEMLGVEIRLRGH